MKRMTSLLITLFFVLIFLTSGAQSSWLTYHLANTVKTDTGDPNCAFFWKGRYHLFIIEENQDGVCYAHFSSKDMLHWKKHPITLSPVSMGHNMFSGTGFFTINGEPAIIYHGEGAGRNQISFAIDDMLEQWTDPIPVEPKTNEGKVPEMRHWDPDCWLIDSTYYAISGGLDPELMKSSDLKNWLYIGKLLPDTIPDIGVKREEDISCPNMFKIRDKWMLLCLSHWLGCRYYLGDFENEKFIPEFHARMNWMCELNKDADVFAPESVLTPDGRRVMWAWVRVKERLKDVDIQSSIQTLPRELSLPPDGVLRIKPLRELENLRNNERSESNVRLKSGDNYVLKRISGDAIEIAFEISNISAEKYGINVYCDKYGRNGFPIKFQKDSGMFLMDTTKVPFQLEKNEPLKIRVFLDKNIIEVFLNDRQAALAPHKYLKNNTNVSVFCEGGNILIDEIIGWDIKSIYTNCEQPIYKQN